LCINSGDAPMIEHFNVLYAPISYLCSGGYPHDFGRDQFGFGVSFRAQMAGYDEMTFAAQGRYICRIVEFPAVALGVFDVVPFKFFAGAACPATVPVAFKGLRPNRAPHGRPYVFLICHCRPALALRGYYLSY
jgi:hypothetical protein